MKKKILSTAGSFLPLIILSVEVERVVQNKVAAVENQLEILVP